MVFKEQKTERCFLWIAPRLALVLGSLLVCFIIIETGYRLLDPFPYYSEEEINATEHGNLSQYDDILGWKGVPGGRGVLVTMSNKVRLQHNKQGFRDIEHDKSSELRPAIVFLGDSFTWGHEVEFKDTFVSILRDRLPDYSLFNLAHRGYGTDQSLLTFKQWSYNGPIQLVILMFSENDVNDNNADFRWEKPKPMFQIVENQLVLTGVPVPKLEQWASPSPSVPPPPKWKKWMKRLLYWSHFFQDIAFRIKLTLRPSKDGLEQDTTEKTDLILTSRILQELKKDVERRSATLIVSFIPSKAEIEDLVDSPPYQLEIAAVCQNLDLKYFDLAPYLKKAWFRTYFRRNMHLNARGNRIVADALYEYLDVLRKH